MKQARRNNLWPALLLWALLLTACREATVYTDYRDLPAEGWRAADTLQFSVDSIAAPGTYVLHLGLRTSSAPPYPYRSITLAMQRTGSGLPAAGRCDTITMALATPGGDISGRGVSTYEYVQPADTFHLPAGGHCHLRIYHLMRRTPLPGVINVGVELERME